MSAVLPVTTSSATAVATMVDTRGFVARSLGALSIKGLGTLAALLLQLLLARWLGVDEYGLFTALGVAVAVLAQFGKLGMEPATMRFVASYHGTGAANSLAGFRRWRRHLILLSQGTILLVAVATLCFCKPWLDSLTWQALMLASLAAPLTIGLDLALADWRAMGWTLRAEFTAFIARPLAMVMVVATLFAIDWPGTAAGGLAALALVLLLLWLWTKWTSPPPLQPAIGTSTHDASAWRTASLYFAWITLLQVILTQADIGMVGLLLGNQAVGGYATAARLAQLASLGLLAATAVGAPQMASSFAQHDQTRLRLQARRISLVAAALMTPAIVALAVLGPALLGLFNSTFVTAYVPLLILLCGQLVNGWTGCAGYLLHMTGHHRDAARAQTLAALVQLVALVVLTPWWGVLGAALAAALGQGLWNLLAVLLVWQRLRINSTCLPLTRPDAEMRGTL